MKEGLFAFAIVPGLALAAPAHAQDGDWQTAHDAGRAHLEKGEAEEGLADLTRALDLAAEGMEKANTLYMLAAARFQAEDHEAAAARLDEIIAYHDAGGFENRDFLKNVLRRAAMVAYRQKDREAVEAYTERRMRIDATNPDIWKIDEAADTLRHRATGLLYKPEVAGFERRRINVFKPDGSDVGGDYVLQTEKGEIAVTAYATQNIPLSAEQHLHSAVQSLRAEMNLPEKVGEGAFAPWGAAGPQGHFALYRATKAAEPIESGLWVVADGETHYKLRVSYPAAVNDEAQAAIEKFIADFGWPAQ